MAHPTASTTWAGIGYLVISLVCFAILDTTNKYLIASVPLLMVLFVRYAVQAVLTTVFLLPRRGRSLFHTQHPWLQVLRGLLLLLCSVLAFFSLQRMPIAEFAAIALLTPLSVTILARVFLKEHVPPVRWACVSGGMVGALMIVRPGGSLSGWDALLPVLMVVAYSVFQILTSRMTRTEDPMTLHFFTGWVGTLGASLLVLGWWTTALTPMQWLLLGMVGFMGTVGHYLRIMAFARAHASELTPFLYLQIALSGFAGWVVFGHVPQGMALLGMLLIAACGMVAGWHMAYEQRKSRTPSDA